MAYLVDHPPRIRQYRSPRRAKPSGVCVVHTAESFPDETGPDTGAENVAAFIARRTNYGSYHDLADSDSTIQLVRYSDEAFHDGTGSNPHSYGVSAATQAAKWPQLDDDWVTGTVRNMARCSARYARWIKTTHGIVVPARRITRAQSEDRVPGFLSHAERDPARRTDPGPTFPWGQFLDDYAAFMGGTDLEDDMPTAAELIAEMTASDDLALFLKRHVLQSAVGKSGKSLGTLVLELRAQNAAILKAIANVDGVDIDEAALAREIAAEVERISAEDVVDAIKERL